MTSRTTPVGILVVALAGLIAVGCSAPTNAVFQALLDPAEAAVSSPEVGSEDGAAEGSESSTWWQHPRGYEMVLPPGWSGVAVADQDSDALIAAIDAAIPGLGDRIEAVIGESDVRVSAVATSAIVEGQVSPLLVVLAEPKAGRKPAVIKSDVYERIENLPGLSGGLAPHDVRLPMAEGVRYDYFISDPDLGEIRVRSLLFRFGRWAYLVNFVASADLADAAAETFDDIQNSLRFGA